MKNTLKYFVGLLLSGAALLTSCDNESGITPDEITDLTAESTPGCIISVSYTHLRAHETSV